MNKCLCDICKSNEADVKFKVKINEKKRRCTQGSGARNLYIGFGNWEQIDVCETCYNKILGVEVPNPVGGLVPPSVR